MKEIYQKFLSEEGINTAVEKTQELGPLSRDRMSEFTIKQPEDPETMLALTAAILADSHTNKFSNELVVSGRVLEMMENAGYYLSTIEAETQNDAGKTDLPKHLESIEDAMDSGETIFDAGHKHRNGRDLL